MKNLNNLKKETIKKLEELKDNLSYNYENDYCDMVNIMIDYDNEAQEMTCICMILHKRLLNLWTMNY